MLTPKTITDYSFISNFDQVMIDTKQTVIFKADEWWFV